MKKQSKTTTATREKLFRAFWALYQKKRIEEITIKEIVTNAGYHRSTFYEYFVDIYDVLNQFEEALLEHIKMNVLDKLDDVLNDDFVEKIASVYDAKGEYISVLLGENGDPLFLNKINAVMLPILTDTFGLPPNDLQTSYILEFAISGIFAVITLWYKNGKNLPSQELAGLVRSMLMGGVFPVIQRYSNVS